MKTLTPLPAPVKRYGADILREGLLHLPSAALLGDTAQSATRFSPKPFNTVVLHAAGRVLSRHDVIERWFENAFEEYVCFLVEHLQAVGWLDALSISTPLRRDRLCLSLLPDGNALGSAYLAWNWAKDRQGWQPMSPDDVERRVEFFPLPELKAYHKGHLLGVAKRTNVVLVSPNPTRPPYRFTPSLRQTPFQSHDDAGEAAIDLQRSASLFKPVVLPPAAQQGMQHTLPDGRVIELVNWEDVSQPIGKRVQSKAATQMVIDIKVGSVRWADANTLAKYPSRGYRMPGEEIRTLHLTSEYGRLVLTREKILWAYWTGELPKEIRRWNHAPEELTAYSIDSLENLAGKGWLSGSEAERRVFEGPLYSERQEQWRDVHGKTQGNGRDFGLAVIRAKKFKGVGGADPKIDQQATKIEKSRKHIKHMAAVFAAKCTNGELLPPEAYDRALILHKHGEDWAEQSKDPEQNRPRTEQWEERYAWLTDQERRELNLSAKSSGVMFPGSPVLYKSRELYKNFPEIYVTQEEWRHHFIQEEFKRLLDLTPEQYGKQPINIYALAEERGMHQ